MKELIKYGKEPSNQLISRHNKTETTKASTKKKYKVKAHILIKYNQLTLLNKDKNNLSMFSNKVTKCLMDQPYKWDKGRKFPNTGINYKWKAPTKWTTQRRTTSMAYNSIFKMRNKRKSKDKVRCSRNIRITEKWRTLMKQVKSGMTTLMEWRPMSLTRLLNK